MASGTEGSWKDSQGLRTGPSAWHEAQECALSGEYLVHFSSCNPCNSNVEQAGSWQSTASYTEGWAVRIVGVVDVGGGRVVPEGPHSIKFEFPNRRKAGALPCARTHTGLSPPSTQRGVDPEQHPSIPKRRSNRDQEAEASPSFPAGEAIVVSVRCPTNTNTQESNPLRDKKTCILSLTTGVTREYR